MTETKAPLHAHDQHQILPTSRSPLRSRGLDSQSSALIDDSVLDILAATDGHEDMDAQSALDKAIKAWQMK